MKKFAGVVAVLLVAYGMSRFARARDAGTAASEGGIVFHPTGATLDYRKREMVLSGELVRHGEARPKTVWLWAYFLNPSATSGTWSDQPIAVEEPFRRGDSVHVVARGPFHWATLSDVPHKGFSAVLRASALSEDDAMIPTKARDRSLGVGMEVRTVER